MTYIAKDDYFDPDKIDAAVIGIASELNAHDSGSHKHQKAQLLYAPSGCMSIRTDSTQSLLPPTMAAWIPPNVLHSVTIRNTVAYRSIYFDPSKFKNLPDELIIMNISPLLREVIERISYWPWDMLWNNQKNITAVFFEEFQNASRENLTLVEPSDPRFQPYIDQWNIGKSKPPLMKKFALEIGITEKTIGRIFMKETGMSYQNWRQQWRLHQSIELLTNGRNVNETAHELDFSSPSAFIEFFKKYLRKTPNQYL